MFVIYRYVLLYSIKNYDLRCSVRYSYPLPYVVTISMIFDNYIILPWCYILSEDVLKIYYICLIHVCVCVWVLLLYITCVCLSFLKWCVCYLILLILKYSNYIVNYMKLLCYYYCVLYYYYCIIAFVCCCDMCIICYITLHCVCSDIVCLLFIDDISYILLLILLSLLHCCHWYFCYICY